MEKPKINFLGWAFFVLLTIVAFRSHKIDIHHHFDNKEPLRLSSYSQGLWIEHRGTVNAHVVPGSGIKFYADVDLHHKNY